MSELGEGRSDVAIVKRVKPQGMFIGKLGYGKDLLDEITLIAREHNVRLGRVEALGAVQKARLGFYDQQTHEYQFLTIDQPCEITALVGNISLRDGKPMVHAHVTLSDREGRACGGHLAPGTIVFAAEVIVEAFDGPDFTRSKDEQTGLPLWTVTE